jgi:hypothetical protein
MSDVQPTVGFPIWRDPASGEREPARLSAKIRELALRGHELMRAWDDSAFGAGRGAHAPELELSEVHVQIVQLERILRTSRFDDLAGYVAALRERVEELLASAVVSDAAAASRS